MTLTLFVATGPSTTAKKYTAPFFDRTYIITGDGEAEILVAYTEFADQIGSSDRGDSIFIGPFVHTVAEVRLTQVDGSQFAAREYEVLLLPYE